MITKEQSVELGRLISVLVYTKGLVQSVTLSENLKDASERLLTAQVNLNAFIESITEEA